MKVPKITLLINSIPLIFYFCVIMKLLLFPGINTYFLFIFFCIYLMHSFSILICRIIMSVNKETVCFFDDIV